MEAGGLAGILEPELKESYRGLDVHTLVYWGPALGQASLEVLGESGEQTPASAEMELTLREEWSMGSQELRARLWRPKEIMGKGGRCCFREGGGRDS